MAEEKGTRKGKTKEKAITRKVSFQFQAPEAQEVYLVGEFNNWDTCAHPMKKDKKGLWEKTLSLKPGKYEYRLFVNGQWGSDPACTSCVSNEFGSLNCVRIVE